MCVLSHPLQWLLWGTLYRCPVSVSRAPSGARVPTVPPRRLRSRRAYTARLPPQSRTPLSPRPNSVGSHPAAVPHTLRAWGPGDRIHGVGSSERTAARPYTARATPGRERMAGRRGPARHRGSLSCVAHTHTQIAEVRRRYSSAVPCDRVYYVVHDTMSMTPHTDGRAVHRCYAHPEPYMYSTTGPASNHCACMCKVQSACVHVHVHFHVQ